MRRQQNLSEANPLSDNIKLSAIPLMAGFECSSFRRSDGVRIDMVAATHHEQFAERDFLMVSDVGITTVREGLRWHKIERRRGYRDWSSADRIINAARATGVEIIWDLLHFGLPDWINPFHPDFPDAFADFAGEFAERAGAGVYVPVNEISFMAWAAGDAEFMYPYSTGRGRDLKRALCSASIAAINKIRTSVPNAIIMAVEPMIKVHARSPEELPAAFEFDEAQFESVDMLLGKTDPDLGGSHSLIDILGVNHYPHSQWYVDRSTVSWQGQSWTPISTLLARVYRRYQIPLLLSETGSEGHQRADWLEYVLSQCAIARHQNIPVEGVCLYPILSHIAWTGERYCPNGLWDGRSPDRQIFEPLANSVLRQTACII
jgi:beta-glucosidase/6-phospho-beta-glucosidase/beta-galactosidase